MVFDQRDCLHGSGRLDRCEGREREHRSISSDHDNLFFELQRRRRYFIRRERNCDGHCSYDAGPYGEPVGEPRQYQLWRQLNPDLGFHECDRLHGFRRLDRIKGR